MWFQVWEVRFAASDAHLCVPKLWFRVWKKSVLLIGGATLHVCLRRAISRLQIGILGSDYMPLSANFPSNSTSEMFLLRFHLSGAFCLPHYPTPYNGWPPRLNKAPQEQLISLPVYSPLPVRLLWKPSQLRSPFQHHFIVFVHFFFLASIEIPQAMH